LPAIVVAKLKQLEELAESVHTLRTRLQALGLTVELTPAKDATVENHTDPASPTQTLPAGKTVRLQSPQSLDLQLAGWGRVVIRSGSHDAQSVATDLAQAEARLQEFLQQASVSTVQAAREAVAARKDLEAQLKTATAALDPHLGDHETLEDLRQAVATANRRLEVLTASLAPTDAEQARSLTDLEAAEAAQAESVSAADSALAAFNRQVSQLRTDERTASQTAQQANKRVSDHESRSRALEVEIKGIVDRYPDGLDGCQDGRPTGLRPSRGPRGRDEGRIAGPISKNSPNATNAPPPRSSRSSTTFRPAAPNATKLRANSKSSAARVCIRAKPNSRRRKRKRSCAATPPAPAWSARVAHDLIEHRKQAATKAVLAPLEQRLTTAFAELTGDTARQVFLDEHLQIAGIGRSRDEAHAFDQLSQGAKEQLLLCLRLAVAQELATDEPQVLILDDVLVNTDPVRQERILDVLGAQADRLQILILTCHPDRYRGVGQRITISGQHPNNT
jgi:exonuclease SbcC